MKNCSIQKMHWTLKGIKRAKVICRVAVNRGPILCSFPHLLSNIDTLKTFASFNCFVFDIFKILNTSSQRFGLFFIIQRVQVKDDWGLHIHLYRCYLRFTIQSEPHNDGNIPVLEPLSSAAAAKYAHYSTYCVPTYLSYYKNYGTKYKKLFAVQRPNGREQRKRIIKRKQREKRF